MEHFIEGQEPIYTKSRSCRECGCTEHDCRECIESTGKPCHWVEHDLCSACDEPEDQADYQQVKVISKFEDSNGMQHHISFTAHCPPGIELEHFRIAAIDELKSRGFKECKIIETTFKYTIDE